MVTRGTVKPNALGVFVAQGGAGALEQAGGPIGLADHAQHASTHCWGGGLTGPKEAFGLTGCASKAHSAGGCGWVGKRAGVHR